MSPSARPPLRTLVVLWGAVATFALALVLAAASLVRSGERNAIAEGEARVARFAVGAEAALNRTLLAIDLQLAALPRTLRPAFDSNGRLRPEQAAQLLADLGDRQIGINEAALLSVDGRVLAAGSSAGPELARRLAPELRARALATTQPVVSAPTVKLDTSERVLYFVRAIALTPHERVLGVFEVPVPLLAGIASQALEIPGLEVSLERSDGQLLASVPPNDRAAEQPFATAMQAPARGTPVQHAPSRLGGVPALVAVRPTLHREIVIVASLPLQAALADTGERRQAILLTTGLFVLMTLAGGALAHAQIARLTRARAALARSQAVLDQALEAMADGFLICDADERVVLWNARYLDFFPWLRGVISVGVPYRRLAETAALALLPQPGPAGDAARADWIETRLARHRQGDRVWEQELRGGVTVHAVERRTPEGGVVSVFRDVTAAERRLALAKGAAEEANASKSRFLTAMSHEMRTPLNAVLGMNELLLGTALDGEQRHHAELIRSSGRTLLALINDLLDVSRIEAGRMELDNADFDPRQMATEVVDAMQERAASRALALALHVAPDLPALLQGDAGRLRQVLFNLIGNALKFTERGRVDVTLRHGACADGGVGLEIVVSDTGIGIAAEALPRLFERFSQVDLEVSRRFGGSGLGLALSRELLALMGGRIEVSSRLGEGSTFTVQVPLARAQPAAAAAAAAAVAVSAAPEAAAPLATVPRYILVAEDHPVNQILVRTMIERMGHRCDIVGDGAEAVRQVQCEAYDLVLMDVQMPGMDGDDAARAICALPGPAARVPIVAMTANAMAEDRARCLAAGMVEHLAKPVDLQRLSGLIERVCASRAVPA